jgi:hypothetical protein
MHWRHLRLLTGLVLCGGLISACAPNPVITAAHVPCTNTYLPEQHDCTAQAMLVAPTVQEACALVGLQLTEPSALDRNQLLAVNAEIFKGSLVAGQTVGVVFVGQEPAGLIWKNVVGSVTYLPSGQCPVPFRRGGGESWGQVVAP